MVTTTSKSTSSTSKATTTAPKTTTTKSTPVKTAQFGSSGQYTYAVDSKGVPYGSPIATKATSATSNIDKSIDPRTGTKIPVGRTIEMPDGTVYGGEPVVPGKVGLQTQDTVSPYTGNSIVDALSKVGQPSDFASRAKLAGSMGITGYTGSSVQNADMLSKFRQGFNATQGLQAPKTMGEAMGTITSLPETKKEDMSYMDQVMTEDKNLQNISKMYTDYFSPDNQKTTLIDTFKKYKTDLGLDKLDQEIIDAKTVIDGTEDDIRNEIQMAGGLGTDSQVQAMALSRNKVLLKNYNNLVAMRESKSTQLNTMMNFAEKDLAYADKKMDTMLDYTKYMADYRQKFVQNALDQYNKYEPKQLYQVLKNDPRQLSFAESIMGVGPGGLQKLASAPLSLKDQLLTEQIKTEKAQREKIYSDIQPKISKVGGLTTAQGKPMNVEQGKAYGFGTRTLQAGKTISELENIFAKQPSSLKVFGSDLYLNILKTEDAQKFEQAKRNFINAVLRRESGASISPTEFENAEKQYFPRLGDSKGTLEAKKQNRLLVTKNLLQESSIDVGDVSKLTLSPEGELIKITD